jgi:uncharacterized membrane protein
MMTASQAKAAVNVAWTDDLPWLATGASITPVVISTAIDATWAGYSFTNSGATFSGPATSGGGYVATGPETCGGYCYLPIVPGTGLAATTNYIGEQGAPPITMTRRHIHVRRVLDF